MRPSWLGRLALLIVAVGPLEVPAVLAQDVPRGRTVAVNGQEIYYEVEGDGPPLLLLHWFGACGQAWGPHRASLARSHRLIVADLRGHGRSVNPTGDFTHRDAARDMFALLDTLGVDRFRAMGMSSGGMTLIHMATQQPRRVEAMVLIGATIYFPEQARVFMRRSTPDSLTAEAMEEEWGGCSSRGETQTREVLSQFHALKDSYDDMNFTQPYLGTIEARTLIVHGDRDEFFPVDIPVAMYTGIPDAQLWIVPSGGHIPIFGDWAPAFREEALRFLQAEGTPPGP